MIPGVDLSKSDQQLKKAFPGFPGKSAALEVTIHAGQMLYLPAGEYKGLGMCVYYCLCGPSLFMLCFWGKCCTC